MEGYTEAARILVALCLGTLGGIALFFTGSGVWDIVDGCYNSADPPWLKITIGTISAALLAVIVMFCLY